MEEIKITLCGSYDNSGFNNCNVELLIPKERLLEYLEERGQDESLEDIDGELRMEGQGWTEEILQLHSKEECVLVDRLWGVDIDEGFQYEKITLNTINTPTEKLNLLDENLDLESIPESKKEWYESIQKDPDIVNRLPPMTWGGNTPGTMVIRKKGCYDELNRSYYKRRISDNSEWTKIKDEDIKDEYEQYLDSGENQDDYGYDIYTIENFDLELELKTGY